jgi:hypothetical protein
MKQALIEALKQLARGRIDAAQEVADLLMPEAFVADLAPPTEKLIESPEAEPTKKTKAE